MGFRMMRGEEGRRGGVGGFFLDKTKSIITFEDSGIGFLKNELVNNLGTIAKSGTKVFLEARVLASTFPWLGSSGSASFLAILVSGKVRVVSKNNTGEQYRPERHRGVKRVTKIIFFLKEDLSEFPEERRLKDLAMFLPEFIGFPIGLYVDKLKEKEY